MDNELWEKIKKETKPLVKKQVVKQFEYNKIPIKFEPPLLYELDLHGYTIQEAYIVLLSFIEKHIKNKTKYITIITGKGSLNKESLIHSEIEDWFETRYFSPYIREYEWINGNGALKIFLRNTIDKK